MDPSARVKLAKLEWVCQFVFKRYYRKFVNFFVYVFAGTKLHGLHDVTSTKGADPFHTRH